MQSIHIDLQCTEVFQPDPLCFLLSPRSTLLTGLMGVLGSKLPALLVDGDLSLVSVRTSSSVTLDALAVGDEALWLDPDAVE